MNIIICPIGNITLTIKNTTNNIAIEEIQDPHTPGCYKITTPNNTPGSAPMGPFNIYITDKNTDSKSYVIQVTRPVTSWGAEVLPLKIEGSENIRNCVVKEGAWAWYDATILYIGHALTPASTY